MRSRSSLRGQLGIQAGILLLGAGLLAALAVGSLSLAGRDYGVAAAGYRELSRVYEVGSQVRSARTLATVGNFPAALRELKVAERRVEAMGYNDAWHPIAVAIAQAQATGGDIPSFDGIIRALSSLATDIQGRITEGERQADETRRWAAIALVAGALALAAAATIVGVWQYRRVVRPLTELTAASRRLAGRDFSLRISETGPTELAQLAADFNRMASELESVYRDLEAKVESRSRALAESSRLASVGYLAAGVAHEINNPLGIITGYAERATRAGTPPEKVKHALQVITEEAYRCHRITSALLSLAKPGQVRAKGHEQTDLAATIRGVVDRLEALPVSRGKTVSIHTPDHPVSIAASEGDVIQVGMNLLVNALEAVKEDTGRVDVTVSPDGALTIADNGPGIPPEIRSRLFEPFVTTKGGEGKNLGLGLMVVRTLTTGAGATVDANNRETGGSVFFVKWELACRSLDKM